jgi:hypothetical protein
VIVCFVREFGYGQKIEKIPLPVLRESKRIDSLMDIVLNPSTPSDHTIGLPVNDEWLILYLRSFNNNYFYFGLGTETKPEVNFSVNIMIHDKATVGYFEYKHHKIFVWTNDAFYSLFRIASRYKSFDYIYKLNDLKHPPDKTSGWKGWSYKYKDGHFSAEEIPNNKG